MSDLTHPCGHPHESGDSEDLCPDCYRVSVALDAGLNLHAREAELTALLAEAREALGRHIVHPGDGYCAYYCQCERGILAKIDAALKETK